MNEDNDSILIGLVDAHAEVSDNFEDEFDRDPAADSPADGMVAAIASLPARTIAGAAAKVRALVGDYGTFDDSDVEMFDRRQCALVASILCDIEALSA